MTSTLSEAMSALGAASPHPDSAEELMLFGQFVGTWEFDWVGHEPDGTTQRVRGEWLFTWILDGRAIQDIWILPGRKDRYKEGMPLGEYGTTLRIYDAKLHQWNIIWAGPIRNQVMHLIAHQIEEEIVLEEVNEESVLRKWIFSDISRASFNWRSIISKDNGKSWRLTQEIFAHRIE